MIPAEIAIKRGPLPAATIERLSDLLALAIVNDVRTRLDRQKPAPLPAKVER